MNPLQRALIEKMGNDNGFEHIVASDANCVAMASARHTTRALVDWDSGTYRLRFEAGTQSLLAELTRSFPASEIVDTFHATTETGVAALLRRAACLSRALPSQAATDYQQAVAAELSGLPAGIVGTEIERMVRQRVGQNKFRDAMLDYWGGACAVTGVAIPEVLRASHTKPWTECPTDAERLDVFNGFLLSANLDALFDRFLVSFDEQGFLIVSPALAKFNLDPLGIWPGMKLRWISGAHQRYLVSHRQRTMC